MSHEAAMEIIVKESGRHFDPLCVQAWVRLVSEQPGFFRGNGTAQSAVQAGEEARKIA
jgi:HD-GYP domain-containing protein (c-di-GMP phosphodiesterase class II)